MRVQEQLDGQICNRIIGVAHESLTNKVERRAHQHSDADGAASCRSATRPPLRDGRATRLSRRASHLLSTPTLFQPHALQKPRRGRDSTAQGAAKRSPGLCRERKAESPNGARLPVSGRVMRRGNLGPLGLLRILCHVPRAAPARPASPRAIESRPLRGSLAKNSRRTIP